MVNRRLIQGSGNKQRKSQILDSLEALFVLLNDRLINKKNTSSSNIITGPSKTGDIEGTIAKGIHGPMEVHLVIIDV